MVIAENGNYALTHDASKVNCYAVYSATPMSPSGELKIAQMLCQSSVFTPKMKSFFTQAQVDHAKARVHAMKYVSRKFKS